MKTAESNCTPAVERGALKKLLQKRVHLNAVLFSCAILAAGLLMSTVGVSHAQPKVTHGPIVGGVTASSARILVRTNAPADVSFELATDAAFANPVLLPPVKALLASDFFAIVSANGLAPDTQYFYRAVIDNNAQPEIRSFRTFPAQGTATDFTFTFGGCQLARGDRESNNGLIFQQIVQDNPRFFLQLGDWTYPDTTSPDRFSVDFTNVQVSYRAKYDTLYGMNALFKSVPVNYVYDDHDYSHDDSDMAAPGRENSIRGYREMFPGYSPANPENGIWHKFTFGNADFFVLDARSQRHPNQAAFQQGADGKIRFTPTPEHLILQGDPNITGELQMDWLIRELKESSVRWKFICTTVPFNPGMRTIIDAALLAGIIPGTDEIARLASDKWAGFPHSIARLVNEVRKAQIRNIIILSSDTHTGGLNDGANSLFPEIMAGGLDRENTRQIAFLQTFGIDIWNRGGQTFARKNFKNNYGRISVFGDDSVRLELIDETGAKITGYTQQAGRLVTGLSWSFAYKSLLPIDQFLPGKLNFGLVDLGKSVKVSILLMNSGVDTLEINNIVSSKAMFTVSQNRLSVPPGESRFVEVTFRPPSSFPNAYKAKLTIETNAPDAVKTIELLGAGFISTAIGDELGKRISTYALHQNYPNPFNAGTRITYELAHSAKVVLKIFNLVGLEVRSFRFTNQNAGVHSIHWNGSDQAGKRLGSGIYLYRLEASAKSGVARFVQTRKLLLVE